MPTYARYPVAFVRGEGARLWDDEGNEYLDFLAGISVSSVGHCHPRVVEAIRAQAGELIHVGNLFYTEPMTRLAQRLAEARSAARVFFTNSGAEAVEGALKLARKAKPRRRDRRAAPRLPRPHVRRAERDARRSPSRRRSRRSCRGSSRSSRPPRRSPPPSTTDRRGPARAGPGRERRLAAARRPAARRARGLRRARRRAHLRRDPVRARALRARCGPTSSRASCPTR